MYLTYRIHCNRYCVPARYFPGYLTLKADSSSVTVYDRNHEVVRYPRSWRRGINPLEYLTDVLDRLPKTRITEIWDLLPAHWKPRSADTS